jgi:hypothetical protein
MTLTPHVYTRPQIVTGTGFNRGARFLELDAPTDVALIAAAPELHDTLRRLYSLVDTLDIDPDDTDAHERIAEARALLARINGDWK